MPPAPQPAKQAAARAFCRFGLASFTIGTEAADTIRVTVQLKDDRGRALAEIAYCKAYLSSGITGTPITPTATTSALTIGVKGALLNIPVTGKMVEVLSDANGQFDLDIIQTATPTYYLVLVKPDGGLIISDAITFA